MKHATVWKGENCLPGNKEVNLKGKLKNAYFTNRAWKAKEKKSILEIWISSQSSDKILISQDS